MDQDNFIEDTASHIYFNKNNNEEDFYKYLMIGKNSDSDQYSSFLLSNLSNFNIFEFIPKHFTISTKNNSCKFNIELLKDTSQVINDLLKENPDNLHYILNIDDEKNVLEKFEKLYEGRHIKFDEDEILTSTKIINLLQIKKFPTDYSNNFISIDQISLDKFLKNIHLQKFTIKTNKKEYKCNIFGIHSSKIIHEMLQKNPMTNQYIYNFEDNFEEFQLICDVFNFQQIDIADNNIDALKKISEDLHIESILNQIGSYLENYVKESQKIDEKEKLIDSIDQLFDLLYKIQELTVGKVKKIILKSKWVENEEKVLELAAFILQVIKVDFRLHKEIADLLIQLNEKSRKYKNLALLIPFIVHQLMNLYMPNQKFVFQNQKFNDINEELYSFVSCIKLG